MSVKVLIADDDDLMRAGLASLLTVDPGIDIVGEAVNGREAVDLATSLVPDVVVMDVRMPDVDGIEATRELSEALPEVKVLVLTTFEDDDYIFGSLRAGASGFLLKRSRPEDLIAGVKTVAAGDSLLSPSVTRRVIEQATWDASHGVGDASGLERLTPKESEVLSWMARGLSNREIADELVVEESTIRTHVKRILMKLGVRDRVQAVIVSYEARS